MSIRDRSVDAGITPVPLLPMQVPLERDLFFGGVFGELDENPDDADWSRLTMLVAGEDAEFVTVSGNRVSHSRVSKGLLA